MNINFLFILVLMISSNILVFAKKTDEIVWLQNNRPPWMISSGVHKNQGYGDKIRIYLTTHYLKNYKHLLLPVNPSRALKIAKTNNSNLCYGPIFKLKDSEKFFYYSKPIYTLPQGRIIVTNDTYGKLNSVDEISMTNLIQNRNYTFGKIKGIYFYPIDVKNYENQKNVVTLSSTSPVVGLLQMMKKNRIDWIYEYNVFIKWETFLNKDYSNLFKSIQVKETQSLPISITYMACSKNSFGKSIIEKINKSLNKEHILKIRKEVRRWQLDENTLSSFDKVNKEVFGY